MEYSSSGRYLRISPRRARMVMDLVRGMPVGEALAVLRLSPLKAGRVIEKIIKSGVANAEQAQVADVDKLFVARGWVDGGPMYKRFLARAMGRATRLRKRTSHITIVLADASQAGERDVSARSRG